MQLVIRCQRDKNDMVMHDSQRPWSESLPELLISMICHRLHPMDIPCFRAVCKRWNNSSEFTFYPADLTPILISDTITDSGLLRCYSPYFNKMFVVRTPLRAPGSRILSLEPNGWAMLRGPEKTVSLGNLFNGSTFKTTESEFCGGYFCSSREDGTGDPELCGIVGMYATTYGVKFQSWDGESTKYFEGQRSEFAMLQCKPVLHKGLWYCIGERARLGVFDPMKSEWRVLEEPNGFGPDLAYKNCYLVESQEELLVVLTVAMANKVYLPKFYGCPQVIQAALIVSRGSLGFVPERSSSESVDTMLGSGNGDNGGAWFYDLELDSGVDKQIIGCKSLMQYIWVDLGRASP
ncbi:unnamed protein product [Urochloa decumbens]|uniref:F-box domain-containing protein n=1 Tax=Urochloa decumbens TaxID=240449 RepID=A0ABC9BND2_9POAL